MNQNTTDSMSKLNKSETRFLGAAIRTFVHSSPFSLGGDTLFLSRSLPESQRSFVHGLFSRLEYNKIQNISEKNCKLAFFLCEAGSHKDETGAQNPTLAIFFIQYKNEIDCKSIVDAGMTGFSLTNTNHVKFVDSFFNDSEGLLQKPLIKPEGLANPSSSALIKISLAFLAVIFMFLFLPNRAHKNQNPDQPIKIPATSPEATTEVLIKEFISLTFQGELKSGDRENLIKAFINQFYLKTILDKMPSSNSFWQQFREHKTSLLLDNMKSFLKPAENDLDRFLTTEIQIIQDVDSDFDKSFFGALGSAFADKAGFPLFEIDEPPPVKLKRFLDWFSYKGELSYSPDEEVGKILHAVLLQEYDFIRSDKWREFRQKSLR